MGRKKHTAEEIVAKLRQVDVLVSQGRKVAEAIRSIEVTEVTYDRWRSEYGGLKGNQVKRLKSLETENQRLDRGGFGVCTSLEPGQPFLVSKTRPESAGTFATAERVLFHVDEEVFMTARVYLDVNTSSASSGPANQPIHRQGQDVDSVDQVSSVTLMGLAVAGAVVADLLLWLMGS